MNNLDGIASWISLVKLKEVDDEHEGTVLATKQGKTKFEQTNLISQRERDCV